MDAPPRYRPLFLRLLEPPAFADSAGLPHAFQQRLAVMLSSASCLICSCYTSWPHILASLCRPPGPPAPRRTTSAGSRCPSWPICRVCTERSLACSVAVCLRGASMSSCHSCHSCVCSSLALASSSSLSQCSHLLSRRNRADTHLAAAALLALDEVLDHVVHALVRRDGLLPPCHWRRSCERCSVSVASPSAISFRA